MSSLFKKLLPALGIATLTFSSCLFSEEGMNKTHDKSMHRSQNMQQQQMMQDECPTDFYLSADFIYWTVREDGLEFAMTGSGSTTVTTGKGSVYNVGEKYEPGFKVGAGVTFDHDKWDLAAEYIWLHSSESQTRNNTAADTSTLMVPLWEVAGVTTGDTLTKAVANWKVRYNDIHLELGKMLCLSPRLKLRVHGGLQGSWIDQNYDVDYTRATSGNLDKMRQKQNYWGIGLRGGMQTSWYFVDSFSLFADVSLAGLWSELKTR